MNAGKLDRRITFYMLQEAEDTETKMMGQQLIPKFSTYARIEGARGKEYYETQRVNNENTFKITIRYRKCVTEDMIIKYGEDTYYINSIVDPYMKHESLEIYCTVKKRGGINRE